MLRTLLLKIVKHADGKGVDAFGRPVLVSSLPARDGCSTSSWHSVHETSVWKTTIPPEDDHKEEVDAVPGLSRHWAQRSDRFTAPGSGWQRRVRSAGHWRPQQSPRQVVRLGTLADRSGKPVQHRLLRLPEAVFRLCGLAVGELQLVVRGNPEPGLLQMLAEHRAQVVVMRPVNRDAQVGKAGAQEGAFSTSLGKST